jgi:sporulation protein YlmC with PRC-barrel domain
VTLCELLGLSVRTESGARLGRVWDVRAELSSRSLRITGLIVGRLGLLERLGLGAPGESLPLRSKDVVAWDDVVRLDRRGVVVRDEADKRE